MKTASSRAFRIVLAALVAVFLAVSPAFAGPPLICHAFDIGNAKSLPWVSHDWNLNGGENYDTRDLAKDTITILEESQVTLVHMETLRRATLYARKDAQAAKQLLLKLTARAEAARNSAQPDALALFDAGYLAEAYRQWLGETGQNPANGIDGYSLVKKALQLRGNDGQMEFAAALITLSGPAQENQAHAQKAVDGAKTDALLGRNLNTRFLGAGSQTMAEMIQRGSGTKTVRE
ncbi:MAG TPA: hypothetical protein VN749_17075 [Candidatus Eisenbacteria bacterium]|nr:hypothetical protein [Candidatus Eisenbacteria bacterium]